MNPHLFIVNVEAAIIKGDRYLMITRSEQESHAGGTLSMVGGKVDPIQADVDNDAILETTIRREIREEVGVEVADSMIYVESKAFSVEHVQVIDVVFMCEYRSGEPRAIDPAEVEAVHWLTAQEIYDHPKTPPWIRQSIEKSEQLRNNK